MKIEKRVEFNWEEIRCILLEKTDLPAHAKMVHVRKNGQDMGIALVNEYEEKVRL